MFFNTKQDTALIGLVKNNPVLYDINDSKYMDFNAREVAWQKIGDELKRSAATCKVRWIHIRDVHRRFLKRTLKSPKTKTRVYRYDNELSFMRPFYKDLFVENIDYDFDDEYGEHQEEETIHCAVDNDESDHKPVVQKKRKLKSNAKKKKSAEKDGYQVSKHYFDNVTPSELDPTDPIDAFLLSVRSTLRTFSPYHLNSVKTKIFAIVQEQELQHLQQMGENRDVKVSVYNSCLNHSK